LRLLERVLRLRGDDGPRSGDGNRGVGDAEIEPPHQHSGGGALLVRASAIAQADRNATRAAPDQAGYRGALIRKKCS
jgi:hypothetical protein